MSAINVAYRYMRQQKVDPGRTGKVTFNEVGDRLGSVYSVVNVRSDKSLHEIGTYRANDPVSDMTLYINYIQ
jgi:ABC-type branched-subunit amino acid transport system substrate-binding protein